MNEFNICVGSRLIAKLRKRATSSGDTDEYTFYVNSNDSLEVVLAKFKDYLEQFNKEFGR